VFEREKNKNEEQRLSSFERGILESKRRKEQMGGESSISDMLGRGSTLTPFGGISPGNGMSKLEQDEITSLQNMIDDLTTEKLSLKRGMDKNQKIIESLMEENESLTSAFNNAKNRSTALENELNKLSSEMMLHSSVQQSISNDRDASRRGYIETRERANELAREVVELEEVVLEYKSKLFLYENTQTDALERSKELERALYVANEDRVYYQNLAEAMNEERREMQRRVGQSNAIQALIESGDVPIVELLQSWLKQVQAKPASQEQNVSSSLRSAEAEQQNEFLEMSTSEAVSFSISASNS
jgi:predicted RNase H-like nuclease (RuvC/YqgF family)